MRKICVSALALALVGLVVQPASAQQQGREQGRGGFGPGGLAGLLHNESAQKELKLDKDQIDKVNEAVTKVQNEHKDARAKLADVDPQERRAKMQEWNRVVSAEILKAVGDILTADQTKRLKQIDLQQAGPHAFSRPAVLEALNLTADQKQQIKTITDDSDKEMRELFQAGDRGPESRQKIAELRKQTCDKVQVVLNDEQKKTWTDLIGTPFQVQFQQRGRQGGGGGALPRGSR
jgi:Spy/CpxP family protein refolding chaperone